MRSKSLFDVALPRLQQATKPEDRHDGGAWLDTLGAWLLEKMLRRALESGHPATLVGVAGHYAGLIEDVRKVNRRKPANRTTQNAILARLESVGRATFSAVEEISVFLQMLGALGSAGFGVLRRPRSLRLKSLIYHLHQVGWKAIPIIALVTFLIGAIIAQQGIFHFRKFGGIPMSSTSSASSFSARLAFSSSPSWSPAGRAAPIPPNSAR